MKPNLLTQQPPPARLTVNLMALCLLVLPATAQAQTPADAGSLRQQIEKERGTTLPKKTAPQIAPAPSALLNCNKPLRLWLMPTARPAGRGAVADEQSQS